MKLLLREWRGKVYSVKPKRSPEQEKEWRRLKAAVLYRDSYTCIRCDRRFPSKELTAHHIIPREEGGADTMENLVTLCNPCHDFVECGNYRTRADIIGSMPEPEQVCGMDEGETKDWHAWVYGGAKHAL